MKDRQCVAATKPTTYRKDVRRCEKQAPKGARLCAHHLSMPPDRVQIWRTAK